MEKGSLQIEGRFCCLKSVWHELEFTPLVLTPWDEGYEPVKKWIVFWLLPILHVQLLKLQLIHRLIHSSCTTSLPGFFLFIWQTPFSRTNSSNYTSYCLEHSTSPCRIVSLSSLLLGLLSASLNCTSHMHTRLPESGRALLRARNHPQVHAALPALLLFLLPHTSEIVKYCHISEYGRVGYAESGPTLVSSHLAKSGALESSFVIYVRRGSLINACLKFLFHPSWGGGVQTTQVISRSYWEVT